MKAIVVLCVDDEGIEHPLESYPHKLRCEKTSACSFPDCSCGPKKPALDGKLRPSYEEQVRQSQQKASKR